MAGVQEDVTGRGDAWSVVLEPLGGAGSFLADEEEMEVGTGGEDGGDGGKWLVWLDVAVGLCEASGGKRRGGASSPAPQRLVYSVPGGDAGRGVRQSVDLRSEDWSEVVWQEGGVQEARRVKGGGWVVEVAHAGGEERQRPATTSPGAQGQGGARGGQTPDGWKEEVDASSGLAYFVNQHTGSISWTPRSACSSAASTPRGARDPATPARGAVWGDPGGGARRGSGGGTPQAAEGEAETGPPRAQLRVELARRSVQGEGAAGGAGLAVRKVRCVLSGGK